MNLIQWCRAGDAGKFLRERGKSIPSAKRIEMVGDLLEGYALLLTCLIWISGKGW
jgi:hypothetical protein